MPRSHKDNKVSQSGAALGSFCGANLNVEYWSLNVMNNSIPTFVNPAYRQAGFASLCLRGKLRDYNATKSPRHINLHLPAASFFWTKQC